MRTIKPSGEDYFDATGVYDSTLLKTQREVNDEAIASARHLPYPGTSGTWMVWDASTGAYVDSGEPSRGATGATGATGQPGPKGDTGDTGPAGAAGVRGEKGDKGDPGDPAPTSAVAPAVAAWLEENITVEEGVAIDTSLSVTGAAADSKTVGDKFTASEAEISGLKSQINNSYNGSEFVWELGTLVPGTGAENPGTTRIRSVFIPAAIGTKISLVDPKNCLLVYCYNEQKGYVSDSPWLGGNKFEIENESVSFVRILIRKNTNNSTIEASEIDGLASGLTIEYPIPREVYTDMPLVGDMYKSLDGTRYLPVEIGSMSEGKPTISSAYVRSSEFFLANAGDVLTASPVGFGLYYGALYKYTVNNTGGYYTSVTIPATTSGKTWRYTFAEKCWFKFRVSNAPSGANITPEELYKFDKVFKLEHLYDSAELLKTVLPLGADYDTLNESITGKFNLAVQTDTHMSKYVGYTGSEYLQSDFDSLRAVVGAVNSLEIDVFANLGDLIRGYQADPDYESRANADAIMDCYKGIRTNRAFVVGNHDDGCLFYANSLYNDKRSIYQVMYPCEQFNRYTKHGINNAYVQNYYYKDISGVRVITLWQRDFDYSQAVPGIEAFKIGTNQLNWFVNTALDTDLPIIVLTHAPLVSTLYATSREGFDDVLTALDSFVSGGGTVIAVLSGHIHAINSAKVNGINHIVFKNGYDFFEIVSVDLANRTISCKAVNNTSIADRSFTF